MKKGLTPKDKITLTDRGLEKLLKDLLKLERAIIVVRDKGAKVRRAPNARRN